MSGRRRPIDIDATADRAILEDWGRNPTAVLDVRFREWVSGMLLDKGPGLRAHLRAVMVGLHDRGPIGDPLVAALDDLDDPDD